MSAHILASAFVELLTPSVVLYLAIGVLLGTMIGALPGLSATMGGGTYYADYILAG